MKKIFTLKIPLWIVIIACSVVGAAAIGIFAYYKQQIVYQYDLVVQASEMPQQPFEYGPKPEFVQKDYYLKTRQTFIDAKANFIEANLSDMILSVYKNGEVILTVPISAKGKIGSWWETPVGVYAIETKEKDHFSSIGHVHQPWSLAFQGNFFIHGVPFYNDGTEVSASFSGGCIRLLTVDAKRVFDEAAVGMPVLVYKDDFGSDAFQYSRRAPNVTSTAFFVADLQNQFVFAEKKKNEVLPIASITKLMTALVATEYINIEKDVVISSEMLVKTSKPRLHDGQIVTVYQLLFPLLLESSNEAGEAIANVTGRNRFISLMNKKAAAIGMTHTVFSDPTGVESGNVSTAEDLYVLAQYLFDNRHFILDITAGNLKSNTYTYEEPKFANLQNFNLFNSNPSFIGGKIGKSTSADETFLGIFNVDFNATKRPVVVITLGSGDVSDDVMKLLQYSKENY